MAQYLELALKRDLPSRWRHAVDKLRVVFEKNSEVGPKEKTEDSDWKDKFGKNSYY